MASQKTILYAVIIIRYYKFVFLGIYCVYCIIIMGLGVVMKFFTPRFHWVTFMTFGCIHPNADKVKEVKVNKVSNNRNSIVKNVSHR